VRFRETLTFGGKEAGIKLSLLSASARFLLGLLLNPKARGNILVCGNFPHVHQQTNAGIQATAS
jgi:hypothetical protein